MRAFLLLLVFLQFVVPGTRAQSIGVAPKFNRAPAAKYDLHGVVRQRVDAITENWLLKMPETNPAILQMFADRDNPTPRDLLPWSGEFAGKYLTGAVQILRLTQDPRLKKYVEVFAKRLVQLQAEDGYLGPFPPDNHLEGKNGTWDAWGHYHTMLGLLLWYEESGDANMLHAAVRIGDLLCRTFLNFGKRIVGTGNAEMNHAPIHALCLLYQLTKEPQYLALAQQITVEFLDARAGDYVRSANSGKEFFQSPKPRWESLHPIQGIAEFYWITGEESYRQAFEHLWWSIVKLDRHNNGGFSSGEQAQGNPYHPGAIETCCTVAWITMSVDMLRMTGNSVVADELELSTLNQVIGYQHPSGDNCTYNTPMDGIRRRSTEEIGFQIRPGSEQVNCCSANAPRGFGMISDWALMTDGAGLILNWYGASTMTSRVKDTPVTLKQETDYPRGDTITVHVSPERNVQFPLKVRVPHWSTKSAVLVNGEAVNDVKAGTYVTLDREWKQGDVITITLDMSLHYWVGERECTGKSSVYRGPLLLVHELPLQKLLEIQFGPSWKRFGEIHATNEPEAAFECSFEGTAVVWEGRRFDDAGTARVDIDGKEVAIVDQFGPGRDLPFQWESKALEPGKHTMKITVLPQRNPASKGGWINVAGITPPKPALPVLDAAAMNLQLVTAGADAQLVVKVSAKDGNTVRLRDYGTAGYGGAAYASWLPVQNVEPVPFSTQAPLRSSRFRPRVADGVDILAVAKCVSAEIFPDFSYGSNEQQCQVNCVQFTGAVLERVLGRSLTRDERDAVFIHYPITEFEQALKNNDQRMAGVARAITEVLQIGYNVAPREVQPGDFIQYWIRRADGRWFGHSAIVARRIEREDGGMAVSIYGSHKATNGITEADFGGAGVGVEGEDRYVFVARLGSAPPAFSTDEGSQVFCDAESLRTR